MYFVAVQETNEHCKHIERHVNTLQGKRRKKFPNKADRLRFATFLLSQYLLFQLHFFKCTHNVIAKNLGQHYYLILQGH